jgi:hypothetical protein
MIMVFWNMMPCGLVDGHKFSVEPAASVFILCHEERGSRFLRNITPQKTTFSIFTANTEYLN